MTLDTTVKHRWTSIGGAKIFYREAGSRDAPAILLPHGYPCSSYEFRNLMPKLADRWHLIAPDFPGSGLSDTPESFNYSFGGFAQFLNAFCNQLEVKNFVIYLHDFGSQIGLRFAINYPEKIKALIIQNGDIYEDALGPKYAALKEYWNDPSPARYEEIRNSINVDAFKDEFLNDVTPTIAERVPPDLWIFHWGLMTEQRKDIAARVIAGLRENCKWFSRYQKYLREHQPPTLIVWGPNDGFMPEPSARAYLRDLPNAELHLLEDGGHWILETHLEQASELIRDFLNRNH
ncbi:MAG: hydrolase [Cellvibrio sp. 79]|nr:MAG: hydrolase [Cellvibrio sp. 79]